MISNFKWIAICSTISSVLGIYSLVSYIQYVVGDSIQKTMNIIHTPSVCTITNKCAWDSGTNGITSDHIFQTIKNNNEAISITNDDSSDPDMPKLTIIIPTLEQPIEIYTSTPTSTSEQPFEIYTLSHSSTMDETKEEDVVEEDGVEEDGVEEDGVEEDVVEEDVVEEDVDIDEHMYECFANVAESMTHSASVIDISSQPPIECDYIPVNSKPTGDTTLNDVFTSLWGTKHIVQP